MAGIFKAYDIRGTFPAEVNAEIAYKLGFHFAKYMKAKDILVGGDARESTPALKKEIIRGILDAGSNVIDCGLCSTDMGYFASWYLKCDAGVLVTASHNPWNYNGFKLFGRNAAPVGEASGLPEIEQMMSSKFVPEKNKGKVRTADLVDPFVDFVLSFIDVKNIRPLNVIFDTQYGAGGLIAQKFFAKLPCKVTPINWDVGKHKGIAPNPMLEEARANLVDANRKKKADICIAIDGDCDRCFFVDENGQFIPGDFIVGLLAKAILLKNPKDHIVYDVRCSWYVTDTIAKHGGTAHKSRVGHSFIKAMMKLHNAHFGGELSGHYYFNKDQMYFDSAWVTSAIMLELLSKEKFSDLLADTRKYHISGEINSTVKDKDTIISRLQQKYQDGKSDTLDGLSIEYKDWKFNVRPSNTEPLLRLNVEGKTKELMEKKRDELLAIIRS